MEVNYTKESVDVDCTSNVKFEIIPPDVTDIPLPEDISEIPLPSSSSGNATAESENVVDSDVIPIHEKERKREEITPEKDMNNLIINDEASILHESSEEDDSAVKLELELSVDELVEDTLTQKDSNAINNKTSIDILPLQESQDEAKISIMESDVAVCNSASIADTVDEPSEQHNATPTISEIQVISPATENVQDILTIDKQNENVIVVTEASEQNVSDAIVETVATESQQSFVEYVVTATAGNEKVVVSQPSVEKFVEYVASDQVDDVNLTTNDHGQALNDKIEEISASQIDQQELVQFVVADDKPEKTLSDQQHISNNSKTDDKLDQDQQNFVKYIETDEGMKDKQSQETVQYVVTSASENIPNQQSMVQYINESKNSLEEAEEENVQYVVSSEPEIDTTETQENVEYIESEENKETAIEENVVQYVVTEASNEASGENYVQYVVSDSSGEKIAVSSANQPEYIQYVVSQGEGQENIVQYVVTSTANEKQLMSQGDSENYVGYIVAEGDEKDLSHEESAENSEVTYEVVDESSQSHSEVVIEEMDVDEIPENSNNDPNEDIQIYVIEEDNMQTVIEVHVENDDNSVEKNMKGIPDLVPLEMNSKPESNSKKRLTMGNYIEVVDAKGDTTAKLPCHVLGRNLKNPETDVLSNGRNPPKARPGVKVPPMSLTSCIVTTEEISEEIDKKLKAEVPAYDKPKGGDLLFKHKITKRLAEKLCTTPTQSPGPTKPTVQHRIKNSPNTRLSKKNSSLQPKPKLDNADLLAILEGDDDPDWSELKSIDQKDQSPPILQAIEKSIISGHSDKSPPPVLEAQQKPRPLQGGNRALLKLDSEEKRRLAKHQLMNLPHVPNICSSRPRGRPKLTDYNPLKQTLLKNAGMAVYTTPRSKDPPKTYSNKKANDIIKTLVSDWDEESHDDQKPELTPEVTISAKSAKQVITFTNQQQQTETKAAVKPSTPVASTSSSATNTKSPQSAGVKRKNTPPSPQAQIGIAQNKIARIIKKKVIWDPDNPPATYSSSSVNGTPVAKTTKKDVTGSKHETTPSVLKKPLICTPHPKKQVEKQALQEVHIVIETQSSPEIPTATNSKAIDHEELTKTADKKLKVEEPTAKSSKVIRKLPHKHLFAKRRLMQKTINHNQNMPLLKKKKKLTEIDRLLMDEGAVNMIYAVERSNNNAEVPEIVTKPNKRLLISLEKERRNLLSKANIIKQAVLRHSTSPGTSSRNAKPLRLKKNVAGIRKGGTMRKKSVLSNRTSVQSPNLEDNPDFTFTEVNESRIIRRHSSSSFSSTCTSPRRLSVDLDTKTDTNIGESPKEVDLDSDLTKPLKKRQKGVPIFTRPSGAEKTYKGKTKSSSAETSMEVESIEENIEKDNKSNKTMNTRSNKKITKSAVEVEVKKQTDIVTQKELSTCLEEVHVALTEMPVASEPSTVESVAESESDKKETTKNSSDVKKVRKSSAVDVEKVHNLRQQSNYKEISIRRHDHLVQIILTPTSTKFKNALNLQVLKELKEVLQLMSKDTTCHVILLTSSGNIFCHGLDYSCLLQSTADKRHQVAQEMVHAVIELLRELATFPKILVAGVHGAAIGLGTTMLPLFDLVLASDKATFSVPATKHGYVPEGTSLMPWHKLLGHTVINELVLACRELTASEALQYGLVTRTLWPDKFHSELIPTVKTLTSHSQQAMVATKAMLRRHLLNGLDEALDIEKKQLLQMWTTTECQESFKTALAEWE